MTVVKSVALIIGLLSWLGMARAASTNKLGFLKRIHQDPDGKKVKYGLFVPHAYHGGRPCPLILFLHGRGECGSDGQKQVQVGLGPAIRERERSFPFLTIFPQARGPSWQASSLGATRALRILAEVREKYEIDPARIYLTGLSMGGYGTWSLACRYPNRWAAIAPICGGGNPKKADRIAQIPCWCFHGALDEVVPVGRSWEMIDALRAVGGRPSYTEYPKVGHHSWVQAYGTDELYDWLLKQRLQSAG